MENTLLAILVGLTCVLVAMAACAYVCGMAYIAISKVRNSARTAAKTQPTPPAPQSNGNGSADEYMRHGIVLDDDHRQEARELLQTMSKRRATEDGRG